MATAVPKRPPTEFDCCSLFGLSVFLFLTFVSHTLSQTHPKPTYTGTGAANAARTHSMALLIFDAAVLPLRIKEKKMAESEKIGRMADVGMLCAHRAYLPLLCSVLTSCKHLVARTILLIELR